MLNGTEVCAVKHKVATWTGYALLSDGPRYALSACDDRVESFVRVMLMRAGR